MRAEFDKVISTAEVSDYDSVMQRLALIYKPTRANNLLRFWEVLCESGDRGARELYPRATYYRCKAALKLARVGVVGNDWELEKKRRQRLRDNQRELLNTLDGYGEHMRVAMGDEWVDQLQEEAGLPKPDREVG